MQIKLISYSCAVSTINAVIVDYVYKANIIYEQFIPSTFNLQNQPELWSNRLQVCNL